MPGCIERHVRFLRPPWTVALQAPLSMRFSRQEYWSELPFPSPGDLFHLGIEPEYPALQADSLLTELYLFRGKWEFIIFTGSTFFCFLSREEVKVKWDNALESSLISLEESYPNYYIFTVLHFVLFMYIKTFISFFFFFFFYYKQSYFLLFKQSEADFHLSVLILVHIVSL